MVVQVRVSRIISEERGLTASVIRRRGLLSFNLVLSSETLCPSVQSSAIVYIERSMGRSLCHLVLLRLLIVGRNVVLADRRVRGTRTKGMRRRVMRAGT